MTVSVPVPVSVRVTVQLPETRLQLAGLIEPLAVPALVKLTVPVGVIVGVGDVSVTVTVQLAWLLTNTVDGHVTARAVVLRVEVIVPLVPLPMECTLSPW